MQLCLNKENTYKNVTISRKNLHQKIVPSISSSSIHLSQIQGALINEVVGGYKRKVEYKCENRPTTILSPRSISVISPTCGKVMGDTDSDLDFVQGLSSINERAGSESKSLVQISVTPPDG